MAATQTVQLSSAHAAAVRAAVERLQAERYIARLWDRDASLWATDAATQTSIRARLGWLTIAGVMSRQAEALRGFAQEIREAGLTRAVLLGMGGSGLFAEVCRRTFGVAAHALDLTVLDTTDPTAIRAQRDRGPLTQLLVIVSSKSGSTSEISALSAYFIEALTQAGCDAGTHCIAITDAGTPLEAQATTARFRRVFAHGRGTGTEVGGRFSALTYFGLVPAALMGIDLAPLLRRAEEMLARCGPTAPLDDNPAVQLGAVLGALSQAGRDKVALLAAPALASFGTWVEQLIAESVGKEGRGIAPIHGEPAHEPSAYGADRVFIELQIASQFDQALDRQVHALAEAGQPVIRIRWEDRDDLGGEAIKWFVATTITGRLMGINPFDEPNVQESKDRTKALLSQYVRDGRFPDEPPLLSDGDVTCYGATTSPPPRSLSQCLAEFFHRVRPGDYVAVLSFLPRTAGLDETVQELRRTLALRLGCASMAGFGPRYLHSTGQLYKGGPDAGLFVLLTADEPHDLPIPGSRFTFGILKQAQALGDFQAMQQRGRRILRLHLAGDPERAAARLVATMRHA